MRVLFVAFLAANLFEACPDDKRCRSCPSKEQGTCTTCDIAFQSPSQNTCDGGVPILIDHCLTYQQVNSAVICASCDYGFYPNPAGDDCSPCPVKDCAICDDPAGPGRCLGCFNQVLADPDGQTCKLPHNCSDANCKICSRRSGAELCTECLWGFLANGADATCVASDDAFFSDPVVKMVSNVSHGFCSRCLWLNASLRLVASNSSTFTSRVSPTLVNSDGCFTFFVHDKSETCTKPSISPRSTNAP